jgi:high-affinity iron transporter
MLPTFVIALREGLEAALIVSIIAAFLNRHGARSSLRWVWIGVSLAAALCLAVGVALQVVDQELPQRQQEGLETVVGLFAVAAVTYMIVWMKRNARNLKGQLEQEAGEALKSGSVRALVIMAFFAVLREGLETAVFFLAIFQGSTNTAASGSGAILGLAAAIALGVLLYRGGVRINLAKFFRFTSLMLVLVAAGLVATAAHTAHEAGWINAGQTQVFDMSWLVSPGSVQSALLTGMFGLQPTPVVIEVIGWLVYAVPVLAFILLPSRKRRQSGKSEVRTGVGVPA